MWSYPDVEEGAVTYQADKLSTATNPDKEDSMAISILLDRYSFPVVLPNSFSTSERSDTHISGLTKTNSASFSSTNSPSSTATLPDRKCSSLHMKPVQGPLRGNVILGPPSTQSSTNRDGLKRFREESLHYFSNLPHYLRNINWMDRKIVQDIHWLLGNCDPEELDLTVALELLSMDFPDVTVRRLAVQRLESLSNDEVLKYLLQLVQVGI